MKYLMLCSLMLFFASPVIADDSSLQRNAALLGTWVIDGGTAPVLTFKEPGLFHVDIDGNGTSTVDGIYLIEGDVVIFRNTSADHCTQSAVDGVYKYSLNASQLTFQLMRDTCEPRLKGLSHSWHRR